MGYPTYPRAETIDASRRVREFLAAWSHRSRDPENIVGVGAIDVDAPPIMLTVEDLATLSGYAEPPRPPRQPSLADFEPDGYEQAPPDMEPIESRVSFVDRGKATMRIKHGRKWVEIGSLPGDVINELAGLDPALVQARQNSLLTQAAAREALRVEFQRVIANAIYDARNQGKTISDAAQVASEDVWEILDGHRD